MATISWGGEKLFWEGQPIRVFDIGDLYITTNETSPAEKYGGSWKKVAEGRTLYGAGTLVSNTHGNINYVAGQEFNAGLPNITGTFGRYAPYSTTYTTGAFAISSSNKGEGMASGSYYTTAVTNFDASKSNSIYGKSSTVQTNAYVVYMWEKVA